MEVGKLERIKIACSTFTVARKEGGEGDKILSMIDNKENIFITFLNFIMSKLSN